jgi:hypothetical protein
MASAIDLAYQAVHLDATVQTLNNLVVILETLGRFDEAFPFAAKAYRIDPADIRTSRLYGEALLRRGDLARGWPIYAQTHVSFDWLSPHVPEWHGESLADRRLLVFGVDGYGDNIYFLRWLLALRDRGAAVTYLAPPTLASLARTTNLHVVENYNGNFHVDFASYDFHTQIHAVPQWLGVTSYNCLSHPPYLRVRPSPRFHLRRRIGFCWKAGLSNTPRAERTLNWEQRQRVVECLPRHIDLSSLAGSWLDTARLVASLDLLVTVDTGVAHLGGALGVPTYVLLPGASAWHYALDLDRHPFYPSMRMFRNLGMGLDSAVDALVRAL